VYGARPIAGFVLSVGVVVSAWGARTPSPQVGSPRVVLVRSSRAAPIEQVARAIVDGLEQQRPHVEVASHLLPENAGPIAGLFAEIRRARPDLVLSLGTRATAATLANRPDGVPLVFSMVLHPQQEGFLRRDVTGITLEVAPEEQLRLLRRLLPRARTVGVLYDPTQTGVVVEQARRSAQRLGFRLETVRVAGPPEALRAIDRLAARVDALWAIPDGSVFTPLTTGPIQLAALQRRVPVLGLSASHARTGALAAFAVDYADMARQTTDLVRRVLERGNTRGMSVARPRKVDIIVNARTARRLGIRLDPALTTQAIEVVR
jgi:putative ABC transport system substrate-binding protein